MEKQKKQDVVNNSDISKYFCDYNQSLALKELDYDEPCLAYYDGWNGQTHLIMFDEENPSFLVRLLSLFKRKIKQTYGQYYVEYLGGFCTAPLKSQVFEFLYICSNGEIDIEYKSSDTEEIVNNKINDGINKLRNIQNNKP